MRRRGSRVELGVIRLGGMELELVSIRSLVKRAETRYTIE